MNDNTPTGHFNACTGKGILMRARSWAFIAYARRYFIAGNCFTNWVGRLLVSMGLLTILLLNGPSFAQSSPVVYVVPIEGIIDLGLAPFVQRVLDEATNAGAAAGSIF